MKKRKVKKGPIIFIIILLLLVSMFSFTKINKPKKVKKEITQALNAEKYYNKYVKSKENVKIYDKKENEIGQISNIELTLKDEKITKNTKYFYAENIEGYISYKDVDKIENLSEAKVPNYVPFNMELTLNKNAKLIVDENTYYSFYKEIKAKPIKIDGDTYYFIYDGHVVNIKETDIKEKKEINEYEYTSAISVINYHYVINLEADEKKDCQQSICLTDTQYDEQMKYLKDNGYYTASMEDLDLWIDKKINLPVKTVVITIDDGWFVERNIKILEKYNLHATLFLIGSLASPEAYRSENLEIHSHTWNMHNLGECPIKRGGAILCKDKNYILEDLKKSSESLNGSVYFAYPFYEYNNHAIEALKEAGFKMAFAGGSRKVTQGIDKFTVPRFGMTNTATLEDFIKYIN